jgi:branched-chain amino acid transport system substrate-binding protein
MSDFVRDPSRRLLLQGSVFAAVGSLLPAATLAQSQTIRLGALVPLTGAGGSYGPAMAKIAKVVVDGVNAVGGINGRKLDLIVEDDQTSPEAAVRAARKLIDIDKVVAIMGTWASAVTTAVAPLCWESKTFLTTTSGADSITLLPHQGYLIRTQPNTLLQGRKFGEYAIERGAKRIFFISPQTPFAKSQFDSITAAAQKAGSETASLIYDDKKPSYRTEVDEALRFKPDAIIFGGYMPDTSIMLKDVYRAGYAGLKIAFGYSVNQKLIESVPAEVVENIVTISPSPAEGSDAYARVVKLAGTTNPDPYTAQIYDQINLVILALAAAGSTEPSGTAVRDNVRKVSQSTDGTKISNAPDGLKLLADGKIIDYDGASGPCEFTDIGDILDCKFRYDEVKTGKLVLLKIV